MPPHLFIRDTRRGLGYLSRDVTMAVAMLAFATQINPALTSPFVVDHLGLSTAKILQAFVWII